MAKVSLLLMVKLERRREEIGDLQLVDWIMDGGGFGLYGSVSEIGWINWLRGLLHSRLSSIHHSRYFFGIFR